MCSHGTHSHSTDQTYISRSAVQSVSRALKATEGKGPDQLWGRRAGVGLREKQRCGYRTVEKALREAGAVVVDHVMSVFASYRTERLL